MAILKHKFSKNASYSGTLDYLTYKHEENQKTGQYDPILDEDGLLKERENYALIYVDGYGQERPPEEWEDSCLETNLQWQKNQAKGDIKQHQYIIAHPPSDSALLTKEDLMEEGKAFARANLQGFDTLIAVHMDTEHYHIHCVCNSVRSVKREEQPWMLHNEDGTVARCEVAAGSKLRDSADFRRHCQDWLLEYTRSHGWAVKDNLLIEDQRKAEKHEQSNRELTVLLTTTASQCTSIEQLQKVLKNQYDMDLVIRGHTYTLHIPDRKKGIRLDKLGLTAEDLMRFMGMDQKEINQIHQDEISKKEQQKYRQRIDTQHRKNMIQTEELIASAKQHLTDTEDMDTIRHLIQKTAYALNEFKSERSKLEYILEKWNTYLNCSDSKEQIQCKTYISWAGYNPDSRLQLEELQTMMEMAELKIKGLELQCHALTIKVPAYLSTSAELPLSPYEREMEEDMQFSQWNNVPIEPPQPADNPPNSNAPTPIPANIFWWTESYKKARKYLYGSQEEAPEPELAYALMEQEAATENGLAIYDLAQMKQKGLGCDQDMEQAQKLFERAYEVFLQKIPSEKNPAYLQYRIGKLFLQGLGVKQDFTQAAEWLQKSSVAGNSYAAYSLANLYRRGQGIGVNEEKAFELYKIAASNTRSPNAYAAYELGNMCKVGSGTEPDADLAQIWYQRAYNGFLKLEQSTLDDTLLYRLGQMNAKGMGTEQNIPQAISYFERAAKLKNTNALYGLGMIYLKPDLPEYAPSKAISYLQEAAKSENPFAQYQLAKLYLSGEHIPQNTSGAVNLFTAAAEAGNDMAAYQLGKLFYYGQQVPKDMHKAFRYLEQASDHHNLFAMTLLGTIHLNSKIPREHREGVALLKKAAALNSSTAQYQLGKYYYYTSQNHDLALNYLRKASQQEYPGAAALLGKILLSEGTSLDVAEGIDLLLKVRSQEDQGCKELLTEIRENKKKFAEIAFHYQSRADRLKCDSTQQTEAVRFRELWHKQLEAERYLKQKLKDERRSSHISKSRKGEEKHNR